MARNPLDHSILRWRRGDSNRHTTLGALIPKKTPAEVRAEMERTRGRLIEQYKNMYVKNNNEITKKRSERAQKSQAQNKKKINIFILYTGSLQRIFTREKYGNKKIKMKTLRAASV